MWWSRLRYTMPCMYAARRLHHYILKCISPMIRLWCPGGGLRMNKKKKMRPRTLSAFATSPHILTAHENILHCVTIALTVLIATFGTGFSILTSLFLRHSLHAQLTLSTYMYAHLPYCWVTTSIYGQHKYVLYKSHHHWRQPPPPRWKKLSKQTWVI